MVGLEEDDDAVIGVAEVNALVAVEVYGPSARACEGLSLDDKLPALARPCALTASRVTGLR